MTNAKTWQDIFYETTAEELVYSVRYLGNDIFYGRAVKSPSAATLRINVSKICRDWVEAQVPSFNDGVYQGINYGVFDLVSDEGTVLSQYGFLFNWDYEDVWDGLSFVMSKPINGRADSRMKLMYSVFSDTVGQTVCRDEEFIKKLRIIPSYFEVGNSGVTRTIQVDANYSYNVTNNNSWIHISPTSGSSGITVFTITVDNNALSEDRDGNVYFDNSILTISQREAPMLLEVEPTSISSPYGGGSYPINFTANTNFSLTTESPWITTSVSAGTPGTGFFTLYVAPNTSTNVRNGYLRVGRVRVNVVQEAVVANISVSPASLSYGYTGGNKSITITSNCDYNITTNSPWLTLSASSGTSGVTTITVNAGFNGTNVRSGKIYIGNQEVDVYQDVYVGGLTVSPSEFTFGYEAGTGVIYVTADTAYNVASNSPWISVSKNRIEAGTTEITISVQNNTGTQRLGSVSIGNRVVYVTQSDFVENISVSPSSLEFAYSGESKTIMVTSNTDYDIISSADWLQVSRNSGTSGVTSILVTASANEGDDRTATIYVGGHPVSVLQGSRMNTEYFTTEALENGTIGYYTQSQSFYPSVKYSKNDGEWITISTASELESGVYGNRISVQAGDKIRWKGRNNTYTNPSYGAYYSASFGSSDNTRFKVYGNLASLVFEDSFTPNTGVTGSRNFMRLFLNSKLVDASDLKLMAVKTQQQYEDLFSGCTALTVPPSLPSSSVTFYGYAGMFNGCTSLATAPALPATTLEVACYRDMFKGCTSLVNAPELPATELKTACYMGMFEGCTSLVTAPELKSTTPAETCYQAMFSGCTSLTNAPALPATELKKSCYVEMFAGCTSLVNAPLLSSTSIEEYCYQGMFSGCTSLTNAPVLSATTLKRNCYAYMFAGCTSLVNAPSLPATAVAIGCYTAMFEGCTSLATAPALPATSLGASCYEYMFRGCTALVNVPSELPATTLTEYCYNQMFYGCTSIQTAPVLPATVLESNCYNQMFASCNSLNYVKCLAITRTASRCTYYWISGTHSGTFVKHPDTTWSTGGSGIPSGWTVVDAS